MVPLKHVAQNQEGIVFKVQLIIYSKTYLLK